MNRFPRWTGISAVFFLAGTCLSFSPFDGPASSAESETRLIKTTESSSGKSRRKPRCGKTSLGAKTVIVPTLSG
jgi:hypothetical protein